MLFWWCKGGARLYGSDSRQDAVFASAPHRGVAYSTALVIKTVSSGFSNESSIFLAHLLGSRCLFIQVMKLPFPCVVALFAIIVFRMSGIFKCGEPCSRSFPVSRGLSHHRRSCQIYICRKTELLDAQVELNRSNNFFQERPAKRARVSSIDANDSVRPLDLSGFV